MAIGVVSVASVKLVVWGGKKAVVLWAAAITVALASMGETPRRQGIPPPLSPRYLTSLSSLLLPTRHQLANLFVTLHCTTPSHKAPCTPWGPWDRSCNKAPGQRHPSPRPSRNGGTASSGLDGLLPSETRTRPHSNNHWKRPAQSRCQAGAQGGRHGLLQEKRI